MNATVLYDVSMAHWPPTTWLVELAPPLRRYNPETGAPVDHTHVAVCTKDSNPRAATVYASDAEGGFPDPTLTALSTYDYATLPGVLSQMGYAVTN